MRGATVSVLIASHFGDAPFTGRGDVAHEVRRWPRSAPVGRMDVPGRDPCRSQAPPSAAPVRASIHPDCLASALHRERSTAADPCGASPPARSSTATADQPVKIVRLQRCNSSADRPPSTNTDQSRNRADDAPDSAASPLLPCRAGSTTPVFRRFRSHGSSRPSRVTSATDQLRRFGDPPTGG